MSKRTDFLKELLEGLSRGLLILWLLAVLFFLLMPAAQGKEPVWWVWVKHPGSIEWIQFAPAENYDDCVERMLPKVARYFDHTTTWTQPKFKCEVK